MIPAKKFFSLVRESAGPVLNPLGFTEGAPGTYERRIDGLSHRLTFDLMSGREVFRVLVGVGADILAPPSGDAGNVHFSFLAGTAMSDSPRTFPCGDPSRAQRSLAGLTAGLTQAAIPWLNNYADYSSLARAIGPGDRRPVWKAKLFHAAGEGKLASEFAIEGKKELMRMADNARHSGAPKAVVEEVLKAFDAEIAELDALLRT